MNCEWLGCREAWTDINVVCGRPFAVCPEHSALLLGDRPAFQDPEPELRDFS